MYCVLKRSGWNLLDTTVKVQQDRHELRASKTVTIVVPAMGGLRVSTWMERRMY